MTHASLESAFVLQTAADRYVRGGFVIISSTPTSITLKEPKEFNAFLFVGLLVFGVVLGLLYLVLYAASGEPTVTICLWPDGSITETGSAAQPITHSTQDAVAARKSTAKALVITAVLAVAVFTLLCLALSYWMGH